MSGVSGFNNANNASNDSLPINEKQETVWTDMSCLLQLKHYLHLSPQDYFYLTPQEYLHLSSQEYHPYLTHWQDSSFLAHHYLPLMNFNHQPLTVLTKPSITEKKIHDSMMPTETMTTLQEAIVQSKALSIPSGHEATFVLANTSIESKKQLHESVSRDAIGPARPANGLSNLLNEKPMGQGHKLMVENCMSHSACIGDVFVKQPTDNIENDKLQLNGIVANNGPVANNGQVANNGPDALQPFECAQCFKNYQSLGALKMHLRTHSLPCRCNQCGKAFSRPWLLQGHLRTHSGERPFPCDLCGRAFADRSNLRAHKQTHTAVKRHVCSLCERTFSRASLLSKHIITCKDIVKT